MPGRKRKPAAVREAEGNAGHRPIAQEPNFPTGLRCPGWLDKEAKREWKRITTALADLAFLKATDVGVLGSYCAAYSRWERAERTLAVEGTVIEVDGSQGQKKFIKHPQLMVSMEAQRQMLRAGALLGFNPTDRAKVSATPRQAANPFGQLNSDDDEE